MKITQLWATGVIFSAIHILSGEGCKFWAHKAAARQISEIKDYEGTSSPRDDLVQEFKNDPNPRVLIATPASLAEAVSLHKNILGERVCSHAIYLDRNYNGAQFMQSMDRIHRIGMIHGEGIPNVTYHQIIAKNTIDEKVHDRLWEKYYAMHRVLENRSLEELTYDGKIIKTDSKEFEKDYKSLVSHLKELHRQQQWQ